MSGGPPFTLLNANDTCKTDKLPYEKSKEINGDYIDYAWCIDRTVPAPGVMSSCSALISKSGSIFSTGGSFSTGIYSIKSDDGYTRYESSFKAPYCVTVESGDTLSWRAISYSFSNQLCFSDQRCPSSTTPSSPAYIWFGEFLDWPPVGTLNARCISSTPNNLASPDVDL